MKSLNKPLQLVQLTTTLFLFQFLVQAQAQTPPDFDAEKAVGIHYYEVENLQRRLKLEEAQLAPVTQILDTFNREMDEIALQYAEIFKERNQDFDKSVQVAMSRRDPSQMEGFKARTREILPPIAQEVQTKEQDLTGELQEVLDDSQYDKWLKYQRRNRPRSQFN
jgi:hypothetical protein